MESKPFNLHQNSQKKIEKYWNQIFLAVQLGSAQKQLDSPRLKNNSTWLDLAKKRLGSKMAQLKNGSTQKWFGSD